MVRSDAHRCRRLPGCAGEQGSQGIHRVDAVLDGGRDVEAFPGEAFPTNATPEARTRGP